MIALVPGQAEESLLQNRVVLVPERQSKTDHLSSVADTSDTVFIPTVSARASVVVGEILPSIAIRTVVFADGAPRALAEVWPPTLPMLLPRRGFCEANLLLRHRRS